MDQAPRKWGPGLKANEDNVSATEPSRTLKSGGRRTVQFGWLLGDFLTGFPGFDPTVVRWLQSKVAPGLEDLENLRRRLVTRCASILSIVFGLVFVNYCWFHFSVTNFFWGGGGD
ncbi:hypothetical protein K0M31_011120 [Melipona bicolor]|uniref:Uncharacterized protein n=1 Tax=Melipona bicolor TaxID=60889 RepID=A0AA40G8W5_9HYME|nr:hypothetical protein K0M31_011120 [Melipona bicolor]